MRIAIIGTGISGLTAAYLLSKQHNVVVYESESRIGGHTATVDIEYEGVPYALDTGFIVFNDWTYPNFTQLLIDIGVESQPTDMGFSVSCDQTLLEYSGTNIDTLFTQRKNIFRPCHWRMIRDILRFNKQAPLDLEKGGCFNMMTLGEYLAQYHYSDAFIDKYLVPMGAAIWSSSTAAVKKMPLLFFIRFFINHGLLSVSNRPQWHVIKGGSKSYLKPLTRAFNDCIRVNSPVNTIERIANDDGGYSIKVSTASDTEIFDHVVVATHSHQALSMLSDASEEERSVLGDIHYQDNEVVLHTDENLLPRSKKAWSSWNYKIPDEPSNDVDHAPPVLTYNMNILQGLHSAPCTFCVTLNKTEVIDPSKVLGVYHYEHPVFSSSSISAQRRWEEVNGIKNTWFCGAYWGNGFHEDGVKSAVRVAKQFDIHL